jgi:prepilin-type N-terminal cleavage/methylation domain-containing protein
MIHDERGLTLAEILVATAIIAIGLVGLAAVVPVSTYGLQEGNQLSTATFLAEQGIERARSAAWTAAPAQDCLGVSANPNAPPTGRTRVSGLCTGANITTFPDEAAVTGFPGYSRTTRITDCTGGCGDAPHTVTSATMRMVTVTVTYRPLTGTGVSATDKSAQVQWLVAQR